MLIQKHLVPLLGLASLVAAAEPIDHDTTTPTKLFHPSYRRKAVNAHFNSSATQHHFEDYYGYQDIINQREQGVRNHKRYGKHIFHGKHKSALPLHSNDAVVASPASPAPGTVLSSDTLPDVGEVSDRRSSSNGVFKLVKEYSGSTFFDQFSFYTEEDPSHGMIQYVSKIEAKRTGLIGTKNGNAFMKIGPGYANGVKKSVRPSTDLTFTTGIIVLDGYHMPTGCGVWPAFWSTPKDASGGWPNGGEIDLVEGVHYSNRNMMSIHAPSWCSIEAGVVDMLGELAMPDKKLAGNCDPNKTDDQGCGVKSQTDGDYGRAYNLAGGGVHVLYWDSDHGIHAYFFPRNKIPSDIEQNNPNPSSWGTPKASWPATHCKPDDYFRKHAAVFTNTVCGTWAGSSSVWSNAMYGQESSCQKLTGYNSCYEYMKSGSADLSTAHWEIKSLKIYQKYRRE